MAEARLAAVAAVAVSCPALWLLRAELHTPLQSAAVLALVGGAAEAPLLLLLHQVAAVALHLMPAAAEMADHPAMGMAERRGP